MGVFHTFEIRKSVSMKKTALFLVLFTVVQVAYSQPKQDFLYYIEKYKRTALDEMVRCGIPASITLAQGLHESSCGKSPLSREANNHFGIKCKDEWNGKKYYQNDDAPNECFRVYEHAEASYADHSDFLVTRSRYADLFKLDITDYKGWARGLKSCGYATNPKYAQILIDKIEEYQLYELDKQGLAMIAEKEKLFAHNSGSQQPATTPKTSTAPVAQTATTTPVTELAQTKLVEVVEPKSSIFETAPEHKSDRKQYMVNGSLVLIATPNEEPLKIAFENNIDYNYVLMFNDMQPGEHFKEGQFIYLQSKKNRGAVANYLVQAGESMHDISQKTGVKLKDLYEKNQMKMNDQAYAGEVLSLQHKRTDVPRTMSYTEFLKTIAANSNTTINIKASAGNDSSASTVNTKPTSSATASAPQHTISYNSHYKVQATDTLYSIARKFNTTVEELKSLNNLQTSSIKPGQKLVVSK